MNLKKLVSEFNNLLAANCQQLEGMTPTDIVLANSEFIKKYGAHLLYVAYAAREMIGDPDYHISDELREAIERWEESMEEDE